jgi:hypothetical protein
MAKSIVSMWPYLHEEIESGYDGWLEPIKDCLKSKRRALGRIDMSRSQAIRKRKLSMTDQSVKISETSVTGPDTCRIQPASSQESAVSCSPSEQEIFNSTELVSSTETLVSGIELPSLPCCQTVEVESNSGINQPEADQGSQISELTPGIVMFALNKAPAALTDKRKLLSPRKCLGNFVGAIKAPNKYSVILILAFISPSSAFRL